MLAYSLVCARRSSLDLNNVHTKGEEGIKNKKEKREAHLNKSKAQVFRLELFSTSAAACSAQARQSTRYAPLRPTQSNAKVLPPTGTDRQIEDISNVYISYVYMYTYVLYTLYTSGRVLLNSATTITGARARGGGVSKLVWPPSPSAAVLRLASEAVFRLALLLHQQVWRG